MRRATHIGCWISNQSKKLIRNLPRFEFHIISEHVNTQINLARRWYDFFQIHIGQFWYRASCKGCLTVSKQTLRLAGLKLSFSERFFHIKTIIILITFWLIHSFWRIWRTQMKPILLWSKLKLLKHKFCFVKTNWKP